MSPTHEPPTTIPPYMDAISINSSGKLALVASNFVGRLWDGVLSVFSEARYAPCLAHLECGRHQEVGCTGVEWLDEQRLLVSSDSGALELFTTVHEHETPFLTAVWQPPIEHHDICSSFSVTSDRQQVVTAGWDGLVKVWDLAVGDASINTVQLHTDRVMDVACSPTEPDVFLSASEDGTLKMYDNRADKPACTVHQHDTDAPRCVTWCGDDRLSLMAGYTDGSIRLFDLRDPDRALLERRVHTKAVNRIVFHPDDSSASGRFASCSDDFSVKVGRCQPTVIEEEDVYESSQHTHYVKGLAYNPADKKFWSCGWDGQILSHDPNKSVPQMES